MSDRYNVSPTIAPEFDAHHRRHDASAAGPVSRRRFLKSGIGLAAGGATVQILPRSAMAQSANAMQPDAELARLQGQQRILLKGGVVLTLDRQVGDFVQADVLIEDGKIAAVGPNIAASAEAAVVIDAANYILIPGFVDTHSHSYQGILRGIMPNGALDPDYNRCPVETHSRLPARRCLCRGA